jgi:hypothetical protein
VSPGNAEGKKLCEELMGINTAKLNSTQNLEMTIIINGGDWRMLRSRLIQINQDNADFWMVRVLDLDADAANQFLGFFKCIRRLQNWTANMTPDEAQAIDRKATLDAMAAMNKSLQEKIDSASKSKHR